MTTENDAMRKLIFNELTQLISEVKQEKQSKSNSKISKQTRLNKYGNTLSPQQLPNVVATQNKNSSDKTKTTQRQSKSVELPTLPSLSTTTVSQRLSYNSVKPYNDLSNNPSNLKWDGSTPLEKMIENQVSKRLDIHLERISQQTHKLYLDSKEQLQTMTKQLHYALEQVNESKRQYDKRSSELEKLILLLKNEQSNSVPNNCISNSNSDFDDINSNSNANTNSNSNTCSVSFDDSATSNNNNNNNNSTSIKNSVKSNSRSKRSIMNDPNRARSASERVRPIKSNNRPKTASTIDKTKVIKTRPKLVKVSMYSSYNENRETPLSVAIAGLDQIIFEIKSNVSIRRPMIKLWPKLSSFNVNRLNPEIIHVGNDSKNWVICCKLHPNSPLGPLPFVINYQSCEHVTGNTVHHTTDETFCIVNSADDIVTISKKEHKANNNSKHKKNKFGHQSYTSSPSKRLLHTYSKNGVKHANTEKKKVHKSSRNKTNNRAITPHSKNSRTKRIHNFKKSKQRHYGSTTQLSQNIRAKDYDYVMEQYANNVLIQEPETQW